MTDIEKEILIADYYFEKNSKGDWIVSKEIECVFSVILRDYTRALKFTKSYDWVMPVLDKIESQGITSEINHYGDKEYSCTLKLNSFIEFASTDLYDNRFEAILDAVVSYITWYNKQTNERI